MLIRFESDDDDTNFVVACCWLIEAEAAGTAAVGEATPVMASR